jgi:hypothetical protein
VALRCDPARGQADHRGCGRFGVIRDLLKKIQAGIRWPHLLGLLLIVIVVWFFGGLLLRFWLSPILGWGTRADVESASMMGINWSEMMRVRSDAVDYFRRNGHWPENARAIYHVDDNGLLRIDMPEPMVLRFGMSKGFPPESGLRDARLRMRFDAGTGAWQCRNDNPPLPRRWVRSDCLPPEGSWSAGQWLAAALLVALIILIAMLALLAFADPRLASLRNHPKRLRRQPINDLGRLHLQLGWLRRREAMLGAAGVASADWYEALAYAGADADARAQLLALRISARCIRSQGWSLPGQVYEWQLPSNLPIALDRVLLYLPATDVSARDLVRHLRAVQTGQDVMLVASNDVKLDATLLAYASDTANLSVCLDQVTQCEWLLHPAPQDVLVTLLARQLRITRISPYQTRGGVTRSAAFFGREQLLARVLNREPGNYLLVGGRQLGKTSLMKAIERRFADHPRVHCHYLSLRDHRLDARLAAELECAADTPIEQLVLALVTRAGQRRLLLLIDETDLFLREEARTDYPQLSSLRSLSEEGRCHFMLAGFWDLYQATAIDYASPIRNFGEVITLGALEHEACIALATEPLERLGIRFAEARLVEHLVAACGHRANLVAMVCQHGLEQLERGERLLTETHVQRAMRSDALLEALAGWARLSPDPKASLLDRVIVYRVAQLHASRSNDVASLLLADLMRELAEQGVGVDAEALRGAISRLQLAYVLKREGEGFAFAVPLFAMQFRAQEVDALLHRELQALREVTKAV